MPISDWLKDRDYVGASMDNNALSGLRGAVSAGVQEALSSPVFGDMTLLGGGEGGIGSIGTGQGTPGDFGIGPHGMGDLMGKVGNAAGMLTGATGLGMAGNALGTLADQVSANQKLEAVGLPGLSFGDYFGSFASNAMPGATSRALGIRDTDQRMFDKMHQLGYTDYIGSEDESIGSGWNDFSNYIGAEDESMGYGWGGDESDSSGDSEGEAQGGRGDADGGGWD